MQTANNSLIGKVKRKLIKTYTSLNYKRKARLYCVGSAKSGTHSIDSMFNETVRSQHEVDSGDSIKKILEISKKNLSEENIISFIKKRDKKLCLDIDSSQLNFFFLDHILNEFPDALFLLTIRDCYSWLDSFINDSLRRNPDKNWILLRDHRFRAEKFTHSQEEEPLKRRGLYTLDGYLSYWAYHNNKVLSSIPQEKLMIVKTSEISNKAHSIAEFAGLPKNSIRLDQTHSFKNPKKFKVLEEIDEKYLELKIDEYCRPLMDKFFPEIKTFKDSSVYSKN